VKYSGRKAFLCKKAIFLAVVFALAAFPAVAQQEEVLDLQDVVDRMTPETLQKVSSVIVQPVQSRFKDRATTESMLGEPLQKKITKHQSIHDPSYTYEEVVFQYDKSRVTFYVFPEREVLSAFIGDPARAGLAGLKTGEPASRIESLLGESLRRESDMLYSDGEWWLVRFTLDDQERMELMELFIFFD
jgi:hypothetical protein